MSKSIAINRRVRITSGGMKEFHGKYGTIVDNGERDGRNTLYRVRLDEPVMVEGVGLVTDDLWQSSCFAVQR